MNKDLVYVPTDLEFKRIVESSLSVNEVSRKLGFKHSPGGSSRQRINKRMKSLGLALRKESAEDIKQRSSRIKNTSNFKNKSSLGNVGEANFIKEATKYKLEIFKPLFDGSSIDFIVILDNKPVRIQVKTSEFRKTKNTISFSLTTGTGYIKGNRIKNVYEKDIIDYFYLYSVELDQSYIIPFEQKQEIIIRLAKDKYVQKTMNFAEDLLFSKFMEQYT